MSAPQDDLESRLRRYAEIFDGEVAADGAFDRRILARLAVTNRARPARRPLLRELALGALVVLFVAALGIGFAKLRADRSAAIGYVPSVALSPGPIDLGSNFTVPSFRMATPEKGWAVGRPTGPAGASEAILRTDDGGSHWRNVTPPGSPSDAKRTAAFLDADHAWVAVSPAVQGPPTRLTLTIYRTADRGRTWQSAQVMIPDGTGAGQLDFVDTRHGWLIAATNNGEAIYRTTDGGIHWTVASLMPIQLAGGPLDQAADGSLPNHALVPPASEGSPGPSCRLDPFVGLSFKDASTGWGFGSCMGLNATYFFVTHDGGQVWAQVPLTYPAGYPGPCQCWTAVTPPAFTSSQDGWFVLTLSTAVTTCQAAPAGSSCATNTAPKLSILYTSHDSGKTWQPVTLPDPAGVVALADRRNGWFAGTTAQNASDRLWVTTDGGLTWTPVTTDVVLSSTELQVVSPSAGWSVGFDPGGHSILFQTTDGGLNWRLLMPTLTG